MKVIILSSFYPPAFKAGGPIRSVSNMVNLLQSKLDFVIITSNEDLGGEELPLIDENAWYSDPQRIYLREKGFSGKLNFFRQIFENSSSVDILYMNSLFSFRHCFLVLLLYKLKLLRLSRLVIAPRGQLINEAFKAKYAKKYFFVSLIRLLGLNKNVVFHATSNEEALAINSVFDNEVVLCPTIPSYNLLEHVAVSNKVRNQLRCVYSARIHPHKNLFYILERIRDASKAGVDLSLDVYGVREDESYFDMCIQFINDNGLTVVFHGAVSHSLLAEALPKYDLFVLATLSENFGHSIAEALSLGLPVLISDRTPFRDLASEGVGFDVSLDEPTKFVDGLHYFCALEEQDMTVIGRECKAFMGSSSNLPDIESSYLKLFKVI